MQRERKVILIHRCRAPVGDIYGLDGSSHSAHDLIFCLNKISDMLINSKNYQISETRWKNWLRYRHKTLKSFDSHCFPHSPISCSDTEYCRLQMSCPAWRAMPQMSCPTWRAMPSKCPALREEQCPKCPALHEEQCPPVASDDQSVPTESSFIRSYLVNSFRIPPFLVVFYWPVRKRVWFKDHREGLNILILTCSWF